MGVWTARPEAKDAGNDPNSVDHVRSMSEPQILNCRRWKENGMRTAPTYSWFRYLSMYLPLAVRDVGNDGLCSRFLVLRAGRSHVFPVSRFTNGPDPRSSLSLSLILLYSPTCCSEEFTEVEPTCILPAPRGTVHPPFPPPFAPVA